MMLSQEAVQKILGIEEAVNLTPQKMVGMLTITFFPGGLTKSSENIRNFAIILEKSLRELNVKVIPYDESLEVVPISRIVKRFIKIVANNLLFVFSELFRISHNYHYIAPSVLWNLLKRHRIKHGVSVVALGEGDVGKLPMDFMSSFTQSSVITILDRPSDIDENTGFQKHFDTAMAAFAYNMTQIVILVDDKKWVLYNFNASHPVYNIDGNLTDNILQSLVPKIAAPIRPPLLHDFIFEQTTFDPTSDLYVKSIEDLRDGGSLFYKTDLYPAGKKLDDLPFRTRFYRWIGSIHLDHRNGMAYGFLARQLPTHIPTLIPFEDAVEHGFSNLSPAKDYFIKAGHIYIVLDLSIGKFILVIPPVWVLTQRSGADKTHLDVHKDLLVLGLVDGKMHIQTPEGLKLTKEYKPSFDTKVILAHAIGNIIIAAVIQHINPNSRYVGNMRDRGLALAHWHGYFHPDHIPKGWYSHGFGNPHVACSTPQSAIFALQGKLDVYQKSLNDHEEYLGDIHIEPHHGTNITYSSIRELAQLLIDNPKASVLGNKYLGMYHK